MAEKIKTASNSQIFQPKFMIIDDDFIILSVIKSHLKSEFPNATVDTSSKPVVTPGYDVYFLDNDFDGQALATVLLERIRELAPHSLVVALSNTLNLESIRSLINGGCNAIYDKRALEKSTEARSVIKNYLSVLEENHRRSSKRPLIELIGSIKGLLKEWNQRLEKDVSRK